MRIVVTGALGHIGSRLIRDLPSRIADPEILLLDDLCTQRFSSLFNLPNGARYHFVECDVTEANWTRSLREPMSSSISPH